jgi:hypothetical protein
MDVQQDVYVVVMQEGGSNPKPPHAVYEACGFGFRLQRKLAALSIHCYVDGM